MGLFISIQLYFLTFARSDGISDIVISGVSGSNGKVYVIFGKAKSNSRYAESFYVSTLSSSTTNGFVLTGWSDSSTFGESVSAAGDVNNDGYFDFMFTPTKICI